MKAKPFLKWAGGKSQLLAQLDAFYPPELREGKIIKYAEPFLGGGSVFFEVMQTCDIRLAYLSDTNKELILAYKVVQAKPLALIERLGDLQTRYDQTPRHARQALFLEVRSRFNATRHRIDHERFSDEWISRAAELIFLNKTCFNGLFRLNRNGEFNVPFGDYERPKILDAANLLAASRLLSKAELRVADYAECEAFADEQTFVYLDPPYRPISRTSSFTTYAGETFDDDEQRRLAECFKRLTHKGAKVMLSNSDPKNHDPNDDFFEKLYEGFNIQRVRANRAINSVGSKRGAISELLILNYQDEPRFLALNL
ncbi:MAG: DNA adenine methylase [Chloroherpetonaceae bacterium]|nr:DNA adenine methylase [Chloroherpetonaceae bacterium]MDW8438352.1 DNA adenine methylase [Chloroherpetonaceae bacterium]